MKTERRLIMQERQDELDRLYRNRFGDDLRKRNELWKVLCTNFLQKFVPPESKVLDVGCGSCEFINNVVCGEKYALDLNPAARHCARADVNFFTARAADMEPIEQASMDVVFMSNLLEHMPTKQKALRVLREALRVLRPGGRLLIIQPNIRFAFKEYWDFWDHCLPISDKSLSEALLLAGFDLEIMIPRFLPYTTKIRFPTPAILLRLYLKLPFLWNIVGGQMFCSALKPLGTNDLAGS